MESTQHWTSKNWETRSSRIHSISRLYSLTFQYTLVCLLYLLSHSPIPAYCSHTLPNVCLLLSRIAQYIAFFVVYATFCCLWTREYKNREKQHKIGFEPKVINFSKIFKATAHFDLPQNKWHKILTCLQNLHILLVT